MTQVEDQDVEAQGKYQRSIRLTQDMADRLRAVCEHLGVNVGAYLTQAVGEAVAKHEVSLLAKQSKDSSMEILLQVLQAATAEEAAASEKPKGRGHGKK